jgi:hypothetical protein
MAEPKGTKAKPPKAKPTPPGQGAIDFNNSSGAPVVRKTPIGKDKTREALGNGSKEGLRQLSARLYSGVQPPKINPNTGNSGSALVVRTPHKNDSFTRPVRGAVKYTGPPIQARRVTPPAPPPPSPFQGGKGGALALRPQPGVPDKVPYRADGGKVNTPNPGPVRPRIMPPTPPPSPLATAPRYNPGDENFFERGSQPYRKVAPPPPSAAKSVSSGPRLLTGSIDDAAKMTNLPKGMNRRLKGRLLGLATVAAAAGGLTYLATRKRNENEAAAKPAAASPEVGVAGRNNPPSAGNGPDAQLYPPAGGASNAPGAGGGTAPKQPTLTERVRGNNKANRNPEEYLGEAFDATVKRGRDVGRKHLQGMIARDSVDSESTLKDYKSEGIAQKFDRENPGKAGRILDEYRAMGRNADSAPKGATYADIKARALR